MVVDFQIRWSSDKERLPQYAAPREVAHAVQGVEVEVLKTLAAHSSWWLSGMGLFVLETWRWFSTTRLSGLYNIPPAW